MTQNGPPWLCSPWLHYRKISHQKKPSGNQSRQIMSQPWDNNQWCPGENRISSRGFWWLQKTGAKAEWWEITQYICIHVCEKNKLFQTLGCYIFWLLHLRVCKTSAEPLSTLLSLWSEATKGTRGIWHIRRGTRAQCKHHWIRNPAVTHQAAEKSNRPDTHPGKGC